MSRSVLESIFRHRFLLGLPIVICVALAVAGVLKMGTAYSASGSFWADAPAPATSTNGAPAVVDVQPYSEGQVAWLQQLLATRSFMEQVVDGTPLADEYKQLDPQTGDALLGEVSSQIVVATQGPQLVTVTAQRPDPAEALALANSTLKQFEHTKTDQAVARAKVNVDYNKQALDAAKAAEKSADPDDTNADAHLTEAQAAYDKSRVDLSTAEATGLDMVDTPESAHPSARMPRMILAGIGGLLAGMTLSIILLLMILSRDSSVRNEKDAALAFGLPVIGSVPDAPAKGGRSWNPTTRLRGSDDVDRQLIGS